MSGPASPRKPRGGRPLLASRRPATALSPGLPLTPGQGLALAVPALKCSYSYLRGSEGHRT